MQSPLPIYTGPQHTRDRRPALIPGHPRDVSAALVSSPAGADDAILLPVTMQVTKAAPCFFRIIWQMSCWSPQKIFGGRFLVCRLCPRSRGKTTSDTSGHAEDRWCRQEASRHHAAQSALSGRDKAMDLGPADTLTGSEACFAYAAWHQMDPELLPYPWRYLK